jgi:hypothetical protein
MAVLEDLARYIFSSVCKGTHPKTFFQLDFLLLEVHWNVKPDLEISAILVESNLYYSKIWHENL